MVVPAGMLWPDVMIAMTFCLGLEHWMTGMIARCWLEPKKHDDGPSLSLKK
jgi:hypothetical protein